MVSRGVDSVLEGLRRVGCRKSICMLDQDRRTRLQLRDESVVERKSEENVREVQ